MMLQVVLGWMSSRHVDCSLCPVATSYRTIESCFCNGSTDSLRHSDTYSESTACQKALSVASSRTLDSPRCCSTDLQSVYSVHPSRGCPYDVGRCG